MMVLCGCSGDDTATTPEPTAEPATQIEYEAEPLLEADDMLALLNDTFEIGEWTYDDVQEVFVYIPTAEWMEEVYAIYTGEVDSTDWESFVDGAAELSAVYGINIGVVNGLNEELALLYVENGEVQYDFMIEE